MSRIIATTTDGFLAAYERAEASRADEPPWLHDLRHAAAGAFAKLGFPTTKHEDWRFTNVAPIAETPFVTAPPTAVAPGIVSGFTIPDLAGPVLTFVNGRFASRLSSIDGLPPGVRVTSLSAALEAVPDDVRPYLGRHTDITTRPFAALNTALFEDGALVSVGDGIALDGAIQLIFLSTVTPRPAATHPRTLVVLGRNSRARIVETFGAIGPARGLANAVAEVVIGDGAVLDHFRVQREAAAAFHVGHTQFQIGRSASASSHAMTLGGLIARQDAVAVLADEGADCTLNGLYLADGSQLVDNHTEIDHATPHGTSHELYKGILGGRARAVFNGRIRVRPDAQKTDARQTNKTLLLSDEAQIHTKPQLEIFANDVKCTHGATVGQLSQDALFYLRARGIDPEDARSLLIRAFATDVTGRIGLEPVRAEIERLVAARLPGGLAQKAFA